MASKVVNTFVNFETDFVPKSMPMDDDKVLEYSWLVLSCTLLYMELCDSIKGGDGLRVLRCWRYIFLFFKPTIIQLKYLIC